MIVAVTGLLLLGFVLGHLAGNLTLFGGPEMLNHYGRKLQSLGPFLWVIRLGLLAVTVLHIVTSIQLTMENRRARPVSYAVTTSVRTTLPAKTMVLSGLLVLCFIVYHLLHFTFRVTHPGISNLHDAEGLHDIYSMVVLSFQQPMISGFYILSILFLCAHLSHGISSAPQSLGIKNPQTERLIHLGGHLLAGFLFLGYISIPVAVMTGLVKVVAGGGAG